jgi:hypothetical protein
VITCTVTGTNAGGSAAATSAGTSAVLALGGQPTNSIAPVITGAAVVDEVLNVTSGTWTGSPTFAYQWRRGGVAISGATTNSYTLVSGDITSIITCTVTGTNGSGSVGALSNATDAVVAYSPSYDFRLARNSQYIF